MRQHPVTVREMTQFLGKFGELEGLDMPGL
jgi:hypothetical protein